MADPNDFKTEELSSPSLKAKNDAKPTPTTADDGTVAFLPPGAPGDNNKTGAHPKIRNDNDSERTAAHRGPRPPSSLGETIGIHPESPLLGDGGPSIPKQIGNYEILDVLGRGGMGVVYKARQKGLNRMAALKMILAAGHASTEDFLRFQTEAEAVAKLQHPNIVQIFDIDQHDGHPFFSLEYVDGGTLAGKLTNNPLPGRIAAELIEPLARAMGYAHDNGILHRDLKPGNILLTLSGTPKITDFGLAKRMGDDSSNNTGTGSILGTPAYMAPEQAEGKIRELGPGVDIYALGSVLYHALTGRPPFMGETVLDTLQQVKNDDPLPPSKLQPKVPVDLETICLKCLQKEPRKRYLTAVELADDLHRFLNSEPIKARPVGYMEVATKWAKRRPAVAALLATILLLVSGSLVGMTTLWLRAEGLRSTAQANEKLAVDNGAKAIESEKVAQANLEQSKRTLYAAEMNLAQDAIKEAKINRLRDLLRSQKDAGLVGFEWKYLTGLLESDLLPLKGHTKLVKAIAFRPPGDRQFASASGDGSVVLWDIRDKDTPLFTRLKEHAGVVRSLAFNKDGQKLASAGEDGVIQVWDLTSDSRDPAQVIAASRLGINRVAFGPTSEWLVAGGDDGSVKIWPLTSGLTTDSKSAATALPSHEYAVTDVAVTEDGDRIASGSLDKTVRVCDADSRETIFTGKHDHWVTAVAFSADGKLLASASWDRVIKIWDGKTGTLRYAIQQGEDAKDSAKNGKTSATPAPVRTLAFSPDGSRLAASLHDHSVVVWDLETKKIIKNLPGEPDKVRTVAFSKDGQLLATVDFDLTKQEGRLIKLPSTPLALAMGEGDAIGIAGADGDLAVWSGNDGSRLAQTTGAAGAYRSMVFDPATNEWIVAGEDGCLTFWKPPLEKDAHKIGDRWLNAVALSGRAIAAGAADGSITLRDRKSLGSSTALSGHSAAVRGLAFSEEGKQLASASADRTAILWDPATAAVLFKLPHEAPVLAVVYQPGGSLVATASADRVIRLWDSSTGKFVRDLKGHTHAVTCLAFSPDGRRLVSGSDDGAIKLWDPTSGQETLTLRGHTQGISSVAFNPGATRLVSTSWDQTLRIWETPK